MKRVFRTALLALLILAPAAASAQIQLLPPCTASGNCGISDILAVFINLTELLLGVVGAVALGYFVYGGFVFILSRGSKGEVDRAFGILRSAAIGIFIIFLSGVLVRFTTQALTGGTSAIPTIGETCDPATKKSVLSGAGLWVSIPPGVDANGQIIPEGLVCVKKEQGLSSGGDCVNLNGVLKERSRVEEYHCIDAAQAKTSCVRGLCNGPNLGANFACCLKP